MSVLGLWEPNYRDKSPFPYGPETTYRMGAEFLADCRTVEDWGCGAQWFREVFREVNPSGTVIGIDGSAGFCDRVADLAEYRSAAKPDGIFIRHVLEHNRDWRTILGNALDSFTRKLCLVLFTPPTDREISIYEYQFPQGGSVPNLCLPRAEIESLIRERRATCRVEETESPGTEFGVETLVFAERTP